MKRRCLTCPKLINTGTRCQDCSRKYEQARGTRTQRGYDSEYRKQLHSPDYVNASRCDACGCEFTPDNPKTGGHSVPIRQGGKGSKIVPHCRKCNYGWLRTNL